MDASARNKCGQERVRVGSECRVSLGSDLVWGHPKLVDDLLSINPLIIPDIVHAHTVTYKLHHVLVGRGDRHRQALRPGAVRVASGEVVCFETVHSRVWDVHGLQRGEADRDLIGEYI